MANLSALGSAGQGSAGLTVGFVQSGSANKTMLLRGIGPGLTPFGVPGALSDPLLTLFDASANVPLTNNARAINFSFRAQVANGSAALTAGFVITGNNLKRVLIRAVGPSLASFNVGTPIPDPVLTLFAGSLSIAQNQKWGGQAALSSTFTDVGAFALPSASADSAVVLNLAPGYYTAEVASASGTMGLTMIEIYEVP